ncbi:hypothetical protein [Streptomyces sp. 8L]|uniref:hypothetical protein n=1 Tax=Streptomyces sp. 8L TaxID=2877242 RepID=UPI001CD29173|nr:hypothetical protein [Streptomyces sp. 8L]MCA1220459.1 hypothetical protein [Streptomyces sp. 8L]
MGSEARKLLADLTEDYGVDGMLSLSKESPAPEPVLAGRDRRSTATARERECACDDRDD